MKNNVRTLFTVRNPVLTGTFKVKIDIVMVNNLVFIRRGNAKASDADLAEAARTTNPEEINIDIDDDDDESGDDVDGK